MNIDDRLRDLRRATGYQVHPSPGLLHRIQASVDAPRPSRWVTTVALTAVAAMVLVIAVLPFRHDGGQRVATRPPTREEFVAAADQRCLAYREQHDRVVPTFPTPEAFAMAADNRIPIIEKAIADAETLGAPPEARAALATALAHLHRGLDLAVQTRQRAGVGDADGAATAFQGEEDAVDQAAAVLADYGARDCRPPQGP